MTLETARQIAAIKHSKPLTNAQWDELFKAERILKQAGELVTATYSQD